MANQERQMSMADNLSGVTESFAAFWEARNARERAILAGGAALLMLGLLYAILLGPALSGRERMNKDLPQLRAQVAQLQALARDAAGLASSTPANPAPLTKEGLEADLARRSLKADSVAVTGEIARLQLSAVSFAALVGWLDEIQKSALVSVVEANIVAQAQPDTVNATLTLRQQKGE
jgi:general secretion pathway protein M